MKEQVGLLAGKAWQAIGGSPGILVSQLAKSLGVDPSMAVFAAGWLAREDKVRIEPQGRDFKIWLSDREAEVWKATKR